MSKKILFLHGYAQSAQIFSAKTGGLRKALIKQGYETIYLDGSLKLNQDQLHESSNQEIELMGWWPYGMPDYDESDGVQKVLEEVKKHQDEIVGIIGFSQGAGLAGYLTTRYKEWIPSLKFAIFFSGFRLMPSRFDKYYQRGIELPNLHVLGELDTVVEEGRSLKLYEACKESNRTMLRHQGGHFVPNSKDFVNKVIGWIDANTKQTEDVDTLEEKTKIEDDDLFSAIDNMGKA